MSYYSISALTLKGVNAPSRCKKCKVEEWKKGKPEKQWGDNESPKHLRYALRMALAGLSMRSNRFTPDATADRAARIAPRPPPLFGSPMGVFSPLQFPFQSSPSYEFTK